MSTDTVSIASNWGMVVLYDPDLLQERVKDPSRWWKGGPLATAERADGRIALWPISSKASGRSYRFRLGDRPREAEQPYVCGVTDPAPLRVEGEEVFLGPVERLPGDGAGDRLPALPDQGRLVAFPPGTYAVQVHVLNWQGEERFWNEDNEPTADAPPDFVIEASPVDADALPEAPGEPAPLLDLIPRKTPTASKKVRYATRPRPVEEPPQRTRRRSGARTGGATATRKAPPKPELRPGEMGVGASVRHPSYGVGTVLFVREGFPKARVNFGGREYKVDKDDLSVL